MLTEGIDLSQWDPRTIAIAKKYGLEKNIILIEDCQRRVRFSDGNIVY